MNSGIHKGLLFFEFVVHFHNFCLVLKPFIPINFRSEISGFWASWTAWNSSLKHFLGTIWEHGPELRLFRIRGTGGLLTFHLIVRFHNADSLLRYLILFHSFCNAPLTAVWSAWATWTIFVFNAPLDDFLGSIWQRSPENRLIGVEMSGQRGLSVACFHCFDWLRESNSLQRIVQTWYRLDEKNKFTLKCYLRCIKCYSRHLNCNLRIRINP